MKKILYLLLVSVFMAAPAAADLLISEQIPRIPIFRTGWKRYESIEFSQLNNSNPDTEEAFWKPFSENITTIRP